MMAKLHCVFPLLYSRLAARCLVLLLCALLYTHRCLDRRRLDKPASSPSHTYATNITGAHITSTAHARGSGHWFSSPQSRCQSCQIRSWGWCRHTLFDTIDNTCSIRKPKVSRSECSVFDIRRTNICKRHPKRSRTKSLPAGLFKILCSHC